MHGTKDVRHCLVVEADASWFKLHIERRFPSIKMRFRSGSLLARRFLAEVACVVFNVLLENSYAVATHTLSRPRLHRDF